MKKIICLFIIIAMIVSCAAAETGFTGFTTYDMEGNTVTEDIFSDYDLTIVNVWTTWCKYCIYEMPELVKLKSLLPDNVNFITICDDATIETVKAYQILQSFGANFQTLMATQEIYDQFLNQVYAYPSTYFIDSSGQPVGEAIIGLPAMEDNAQIYYDISMEILDMLKA